MFFIYKEFTKLFQSWNGKFRTYEILRMLHEPVTLRIHISAFRNGNEHELTHISGWAQYKYGHIHVCCNISMVGFYFGGCDIPGADAGAP